MKYPKSKLKCFLCESGFTQRDIAKNTGIQESIISMGVSGQYNFRKDQKKRIADYLKQPVKTLFFD